MICNMFCQFPAKTFGRMDLDLQLKSLNNHYKTVVKLDPLTWSGHKHECFNLWASWVTTKLPISAVVISWELPVFWNLGLKEEVYMRLQDCLFFLRLPQFSLPKLENTSSGIYEIRSRKNNSVLKLYPHCQENIAWRVINGLPILKNATSK